MPDRDLANPNPNAPTPDEDARRNALLLGGSALAGGAVAGHYAKPLAATSGAGYGLYKLYQALRGRWTSSRAGLLGRLVGVLAERPAAFGATGARVQGGNLPA